jgi:hypothetical protein
MGLPMRGFLPLAILIVLLASPAAATSWWERGSVSTNKHGCPNAQKCNGVCKVSPDRWLRDRAGQRAYSRVLPPQPVTAPPLNLQ